MDSLHKQIESAQSDVMIDALAGFSTLDLGVERAFRMASQALESLELAKALLTRSYAHGLSQEAGEVIALLGHLRSKMLRHYEERGLLSGACDNLKDINPYDDGNLSDESDISRELLYSRAQKRLPGLRIPSVKMLLCFIDNPSEIIPIEVLARASGTSAKTMEIIKVYMSSLRKSLASVGFDDVIITHSKRGYSICPVKSLEIVAFLSE